MRGASGAVVVVVVGGGWGVGSSQALWRCHACLHHPGPTKYLHSALTTSLRSPSSQSSNACGPDQDQARICQEAQRTRGMHSSRGAHRPPQTGHERRALA